MMAPSSSSQQSSYLEEDLGLDQLGSQAEQHEHKEAAHGSRLLRHPLACNSTSHSLVLCWCAAKMQCKRDLCLAVCGAPCPCLGIYRFHPAAAWLRQIAVADKLRCFKREQRHVVDGKRAAAIVAHSKWDKKAPDCMSKSCGMHNQKKGARVQRRDAANEYG